MKRWGIENNEVIELDGDFEDILVRSPYPQTYLAFVTKTKEYDPYVLFDSAEKAQIGWYTLPQNREVAMALQREKRPILLLSPLEQQRVKNRVLDWLMSTKLVNTVEFSFSSTLTVWVNGIEFDLGHSIAMIVIRTREVIALLASTR